MHAGTEPDFAIRSPFFQKIKKIGELPTEQSGMPLRPVNTSVYCNTFTLKIVTMIFYISTYIFTDARLQNDITSNTEDCTDSNASSIVNGEFYYIILS